MTTWLVLLLACAEAPAATVEQVAAPAPPPRAQPAPFPLLLSDAERQAAEALAARQRGRRFEGIDVDASRGLLLHLAGTHSDPQVVVAALRALGEADGAKFGERELAAVRYVVLRHTVNPDLAGYAASALVGPTAVRADAEMVEALAGVLARHLNQGVRAEVARALVRAPRLSEHGLAALKKAALDPYPHVRFAVAGDGGYADPAPAAGALWSEFKLLLEYHHALVRAASARTLAQAFSGAGVAPERRAEIVARVRPLLQDKWGRVRCSALRALGASADATLVHIVIEAVADETECGERPSDVFVGFDLAPRDVGAGPGGTVGRCAYEAMNALVSGGLPQSLKDAWAQAGLPQAKLAKMTQRWYAKAAASLPQPATP